MAIITHQQMREAERRHIPCVKKTRFCPCRKFFSHEPRNQLISQKIE